MAGSIKQELAANSHAVIYMRDYGWNSCCHSVAVVPLVTGTLAQISIFSSQSVAEIKYLGQNLQDFCNGKLSLKLSHLAYTCICVVDCSKVLQALLKSN